MRVLGLVLMLFAGAALAGDSDVLEELRRGEHFKRDALFQQGPEVLAEALSGKSGSISLLGRYFTNGERGFPNNQSVGYRLYESAYRRGHWAAAFDLAAAAEEKTDYRTAYRYYLIAYMTAVEFYETNTRKRPGYTMNIPDFTHLSFAELVYLTKSGLVSEQDSLIVAKEAKEEAMSRGFFSDCEEGSRQKCADLTDIAAIECRIAVKDKCYRDRR